MNQIFMLDICNPTDRNPTLEVGSDANNLLGGSFSSLKPLSGDSSRDVSVTQSQSVGAAPLNPLTLPDPWLFDSESLLREIDRIRETALAVPTNGDINATHFGLQLVINAAWTLRENLRYILHLHREGQRAVRNKQGTDQTIYVVKYAVNLAHNNLLITLWTGYPTL